MNVYRATRKIGTVGKTGRKKGWKPAPIAHADHVPVLSGRGIKGIIIHRCEGD